MVSNSHCTTIQGGNNKTIFHTTNVSGTNIQQLCQDVVKAKVAAGDSGSPVFRITNSPTCAAGFSC